MQMGNIEEAKKLLSTDADVMSWKNPNKLNRSLLHEAVFSNMISIISFIFEEHQQEVNIS